MRYIFCMCVCSLRYPACRAQAPYYMYIVICGPSVFKIFSHIISHTAIFSGVGVGVGNVLNTEGVF